MNFSSSPLLVVMVQSLVQILVPKGIGGYFLKVSWITMSRNFKLITASHLTDPPCEDLIMASISFVNSL